VGETKCDPEPGPNHAAFERDQELGRMPGTTATITKKDFRRPVSHTPSRLVMSQGWALTKETIMTPRLDTFAAAPAPMKSWLDWSLGVQKNGLEDSLMELVKIRASQINGCARCLHMHTADARKHGETEERLYLLDAWRESPLYNERERAALAWTEALTLVSETHAPDDVYRALQAQFTEHEQVVLTLLIVAINGWNRIQVGFRAVHPVERRQAA
jgi:AhpD family alkylhydroperoxidase